MAAPVRIPGVRYWAAPSAEASARVLNWPPKIIVIHDTGNPTSNKEGEASYAHTRPTRNATSAHAYVDNGGVLGSLRLDRQAWAAYDYANRNGLHIEMCLPGDRSKTRRMTAALTRQLCQMTGIPMIKLTPADVKAGRRGICGHRDITLGLGVGDHTDPGADFPWQQFIGWVNEGPVGGGAAAEEQDMVDFSPADPNAWYQARRTEAWALGLDNVHADAGGQPHWGVRHLKAIEEKVNAGGWTEEQREELANDLAVRVFDQLAAKFGEALVNALTDPRAIEAFRQGAEAAEDTG